jgi:tetratricopeptide (TPR) repeat protein
MLLTAAIAPGDRVWEGDVAKFFAVPPQPVEVPIAQSSAPTVIDRIDETLQRAEEGDEASKHHIRGLALGMDGDFEGALAALTEAVRLGSTDAMKDAGDAANHLGRLDEARGWYESAADAGNAEAMYNLGNASVRSGDVATAADWYQRAAEAGHVEGLCGIVVHGVRAG